MDAYDRRAWEDIQARRSRADRRRVKSLVPKRMREAGADALGRGQGALEDVPGYDSVLAALRMALDGLTSTVASTAAASVSRRMVLARYRRHGHDLDRIEAIAGLDLCVSDSVFPRRKRLVYIAGSAAEGGAAGAATTVGEAGAVVGGIAGVGVGGAPGAATVVAVLAADAVASLATASRVVAETGALYGYDPNDPSEHLFMAGVLGAATAGSEAAKVVAHRELHQLAQALARNVTWQQLNKNQITKVVSQVYKQLGERLTKRMLGKALPAISILLGAGLNADLMRRVSDEAYWAYRERRLVERYGVEDDPGAPAADPLDSEEGGLGIIELVTEVQAEELEKRPAKRGLSSEGHGMTTDDEPSVE